MESVCADRSTFDTHPLCLPNVQSSYLCLTSVFAAVGGVIRIFAALPGAGQIPLPKIVVAAASFSTTHSNFCRVLLCAVEPVAS
mmetsp:Transcript_32036/g.48009  ORF Transcript_32036/g.48009 Transcript_32036/m.48009 type:complete len:84 (+) Transcript_32036:964-1215(+)